MTIAEDITIEGAAGRRLCLQPTIIRPVRLVEARKRAIISFIIGEGNSPRLGRGTWRRRLVAVMALAGTLSTLPLQARVGTTARQGWQWINPLAAQGLRLQRHPRNAVEAREGSTQSATITTNIKAIAISNSAMQLCEGAEVGAAVEAHSNAHARHPTNNRHLRVEPPQVGRKFRRHRRRMRPRLPLNRAVEVPLTRQHRILGREVRVVANIITEARWVADLPLRPVAEAPVT